ncbi:hypothetical protein [Clostridium botulinum]|uniref:Uncharacterized protein n=1 Tax=Clostridium botulinum (strain Okra / Type B1) TaxID=498213 RepID=B1IGP4_CLOBK|nr:hypothetical protein [Clostridium botulinum]ACA45358.1 hypothetical protein CLD_2433 [Clostridium botulinum B1 str. Okra]MBD5564034.1 hypothetical protein [Clostridium botulinum]MBD5566595.1 hypothetical protein [Clostridium botulinum]MBD5568889.1 hypothetical protein [Clostridium botulinum]MBD5576494.1 hypothetical protein [Clostridium botulinum]
MYKCLRCGSNLTKYDNKKNKSIRSCQSCNSKYLIQNGKLLKVSNIDFRLLIK